MADKVEVRPLDEGPADLALPAAIAQSTRLNSADWQLRGISITQPTSDFGKFFPLVADGWPVLDATLLPLTPAAFQSIDELSGQCFFFCSYLFRINFGSVTMSADGDGGGRTEVWIQAQAIWRQEPECDSRNNLPPLSLP